MKSRIRQTFGVMLFLLSCSEIIAQTQTTLQTEKLPDSASLQACIDFALKNTPLIKQAKLDEEIAEKNININLAGWYPQINATGGYNHYLRLPTTVLPNFQNPGGPPQIIQVGLKNTSNMLLQADQALFNNDLLLASKGVKYYREQSRQNTENNKINIVVNVSKAFYDILTSLQQQRILDENIARTEKQLKDAYAQYESGLVDKTDYKRATITLSISKADRKRTEEALKFKYAYLKELMGIPSEEQVKIQYDTVAMQKEVLLDTLQAVNYETRVEYRQLQTQKQIQHLSVDYYRLGFLPTLSAFINYNFVYQNNEFSKLYSAAYPASITGLKLNVPLFTGMRRLQSLKREKLTEQRLDLSILNLKNQINTQHQQALANYKSSLNDWVTAKENVELSSEVYTTIKLQYDEGIKTYLDLMTAETDLRTTQINYLNALYGVLASKLDVQQALGNIKVN